MGIVERVVPCVFRRASRIAGCIWGALPLVLAPCGYGVTRLLDFTVPHEVFAIAPFALPVGMVIYYLVWKYFVGFLNAELGIA